MYRYHAFGVIVSIQQLGMRGPWEFWVSTLDPNGKEVYQNDSVVHFPTANEAKDYFEQVHETVARNYAYRLAG